MKTVIGLEIHVQLLTKTKLFCSCPTRFKDEPNTNVCPVCLGLPGALPVINEEAVRLALKLGLALNSKINLTSSFHRKNYFYPDLPKGYQITQFDIPLAEGGYLEIGKEKKREIRIRRAHLEEDAGKSIHSGSIVGAEKSFIDFNRSGIPLVEIVTEPDIETPDEAHEFLLSLRRLVRYLDTSTGDMEKGNLRCDVNISISPDDKELGVKVEVKNLNSFRSVKKALEYEIERQTESLKKGEKIIQETRHFNEVENKTYPMRGKEEAHDYRYFKDPDLPPLIVDNLMFESVTKSIPELPIEKFERFKKEFNLSDYDSSVITDDKATAIFFENTLRFFNEPKIVSNWITVEVKKILNEENIEIEELNFKVKDLADLLIFIKNGVISGKIAKDILPLMHKEKKSPEEIIKEKGLLQIQDEDSIRKMVEKVINENPELVKEYKAGKEKVFGFLIGQLMKLGGGKINPSIGNKIMKEELNKL